MHRQIYRCIRERDAEGARQSMRDHLMKAQRAWALEEQLLAAQPAQADGDGAR